MLSIDFIVLELVKKDFTQQQLLFQNTQNDSSSLVWSSNVYGWASGAERVL
jgi:hypothetical protein